MYTSTIYHSLSQTVVVLQQQRLSPFLSRCGAGKNHYFQLLRRALEQVKEGEMGMGYSRWRRRRTTLWLQMEFQVAITHAQGESSALSLSLSGWVGDVCSRDASKTVKNSFETTKKSARKCKIRSVHRGELIKISNKRYEEEP